MPMPRTDRYRDLPTLIREGNWTLRQAAEHYGVTTERIRQILRREGLTVGELTKVCCSYCGATIRRVRGEEPKYGHRLCSRHECRVAHAAYINGLRREAKGISQRTCSVCGATMMALGIPKKQPEQPDFCTRTVACRTARLRWKRHNDPEFAARQRESNRRSQAAHRYAAQRRYAERQRTARRLERQVGGEQAA